MKTIGCVICRKPIVVADIVEFEACSNDCAEQHLGQQGEHHLAAKREELKQSLVAWFIDGGRVYTGEGVTIMMEVAMEVVDEIITSKESIGHGVEPWGTLKNKLNQAHMRIHSSLEAYRH